MRPRILVVEDDHALRDVLLRGLRPVRTMTDQATQWSAIASTERFGGTGRPSNSPFPVRSWTLSPRRSRASWGRTVPPAA
jgi:hypothetical protein